MNSPTILFENSVVVVVNKPSGLTVTADAHHSVEETLVGWLLKRYGAAMAKVGRGVPQPKWEQQRAGVVHRLDKSTSGVMVVAKTQAVWEDLTRQFRERKVKKKYQALVWGKVEPQQFIIDAPIARHPKKRFKFAVVQGGKPALTKVKVKAWYRTASALEGPQLNHPRPFFSLLDLFPRTGRTHQLRVHLKAMRFPVAGDLLYQTRRQKRELVRWWQSELLKQAQGIRAGLPQTPRLFLHAARLGFRLWPTGEWRVFDAQLPHELEWWLSRLIRAE